MLDKTVVIALGGNAISMPQSVGTIPDQFGATRATCPHIVRVIERGYNIILTHGNGPQIGNVLRRVERARDVIYPLPLDICVADTIGGMGYMIQQCMENALFRQNLRRTIITVITQMVVAADDPAFQNPTKPIGPFMTREEAEERRSREGWMVTEDSGRGYRRVVPSPRPLRIVEISAIRNLVESGCIVIACGGGGIPVVVDADGALTGVEGVIDKDLATALLAAELGIGTMIVSTGVEKVAIQFNKPGQRRLDTLTVAEAKKYLSDGEFPAGSMGPKIEAAVQFLEHGGREVIITTPEHIADALDGDCGTRVVP